MPHETKVLHFPGGLDIEVDSRAQINDTTKEGKGGSDSLIGDRVSPFTTPPAQPCSDNTESSFMESSALSIHGQLALLFALIVLLR